MKELFNTVGAYGSRVIIGFCELTKEYILTITDVEGDEVGEILSVGDILNLERIRDNE
ncbi:hypothetical protein [Clostridium sp.]|uniref:hypothetical protein n=1 Tax=Clostridium sp. TaxID=1506 RepID=UPI003F3597D2